MRPRCRLWLTKCQFPAPLLETDLFYHLASLCWSKSRLSPMLIGDSLWLAEPTAKGSNSRLAPIRIEASGAFSESVTRTDPNTTHESSPRLTPSWVPHFPMPHR